MIKKMNLCKVLGLVSLIGGTNFAIAADDDFVTTIPKDSPSYYMPPTRAFFASLNLGPSFAQSGHSETIYYTPGKYNTYSAVNDSTTLLNGQIDIGLVNLLTDTMLLQWGFELEGTNAMKFNGYVLPEGRSGSGEQWYTYSIKHKHVAAKAKLLAGKHFFVMPWISAALGLGWNNAYNYTNSTSNPNQAIPAFDSQSTTGFTYTVGAGIQRALNDHFQVGVGYEFANWGKGELGRSANQTINQGLSLNSIYTNSLMFNLTYVS